jgi:hypothetical protein
LLAHARNPLRRKEAEREAERARKAEEKARREADKEEERRRKEEGRARKQQEKAKEAEARELGKHGFRSHKQLEASRSRLKARGRAGWGAGCGGRRDAWCWHLGFLVTLRLADPSFALLRPQYDVIL